MVDNYFSKFPTITYANTVCRDLSRRAKLSANTMRDLSQYYEVEIRDGTRADLISFGYYDDSSLDWLIYLSNEIVDPYYQWHLSTQDFKKYLIKKYGSVEASQKHIKYYRNNWYDDYQQLTPDQYEFNIINSWKKYYTPVFGNGAQILAWKRREEDWVVKTNKIYKFEIANTDNYIVGELVDVTDTGTRVGGGEITAISNTYIMIKNIDGAFEANNIVTGEESEIDQTITAANLVYEAITEEEGVFWSPVTCYDCENERNAYNQQIRVIEETNTVDISLLLSDTLNEDA